MNLRSLALLFCLVATAHAQISFDGSSYSQNFDGLANTSSATYVDETTITGWIVNSEEMDSNSDEYFAGSGTSTGGEVYSFGTGTDSDRALGYLGSGGNDFFNAAVRLVNTSGSEITSLNVSYIGEQWRSGGNTSDNNNILNFSYQTFTSGGGSIPASTSLTGWTEVDALDFSAPQADVASGALDGNLAANREALSTSISLSWAAGDELWLRWTGNDGSGTDAGLAIDDFSVVVPEASTFALLAGMSALGFVMLRRRES